MRTQTITGANAERDSLPSPYLAGTLLLRNRRLVVGLAVTFAFLVVGRALIAPRSFTSTATFTPAAPETPLASASGLAAQFGISLGRSSSEFSPQFYADLVTTRQILEPLLTERYTYSEHGRSRSATLIELFDLAEMPAPRQVERGLYRLRRSLSATPSIRTGVVELNASTQWPEVSERLVQRILERLRDFNVTQRQSQAAAQRDFVRDRLASASSELQEAENRLLAFLQANRTFTNSPLLTFEHERLARQVAAKQEIVSSLTQSYEQARIDAVRAAPVFTIIDTPHIAATPDGRRLATKAVVAFMGGLVAGILLSLLRALMRTARVDDPPAYEEFRSAWAAARLDFAHLTFGLWPRRQR